MKLLFLILSITFAIQCNVFGQAVSHAGIKFRPKINLDSGNISTTDQIAIRLLLKTLLVNNEKIDLLNELDPSRTPHLKPVIGVTLKMSGVTIVQLSQNQSSDKKILSDTGLLFLASILDIKMDIREKENYARLLAGFNSSELNNEYAQVQFASEQALIELARLAAGYI